MKRITVLLAEDHMIVREGYRRMLEMEAGLQVVGEAADGRQAIALVKKLRPEVVLMDIAMPQLNGLEATRQVLKAFPATKVLMLSAHSDDAYIKDATAAGAAGFLLKQSSSHLVCEAIRRVQMGKTFFSPTVARRLRQLDDQSQERAGRSPSRKAHLSAREVEVLRLIAEGKGNKESAAELGISLKTLEKHREHLMQKLDLHDTAGLTRYAISAGIVGSSVQLTIV